VLNINEYIAYNKGRYYILYIIIYVGQWWTVR